MVAGSIEYRREPFLVVTREQRERQEVYGAIDDAVVLQAQLLRGDAPSDTVLIAMHPVGSPGYLPIISSFARAGHHVIAAATRYTQGDAALLMESVLCDVAAVVRHAKEQFGYAKVVLFGWSGGGSLMAGYQAQAQDPKITQTAAGESTPLAELELLGANALVLTATHRSRHHVLTDWLDASIVDEADPASRDRRLDLYSPDNAHQPPYDDEFVTEYRAAQLARNRRITEWAQQRLEQWRSDGETTREQCFIVHGTMADPRWLDPALDPNDRRPGWTYLGDPRAVNDSPVGLARFTTCRSWLSQWSFDRAQVDTVDCGPRITVPALVVTASADDACPPSHTDAIFSALASPDKQAHVVFGANHYFSGPESRSHVADAVTTIGEWLADRQLAPSA